MLKNFKEERYMRRREFFKVAVSALAVFLIPKCKVEVDQTVSDEAVKQAARVKREAKIQGCMTEQVFKEDPSERRELEKRLGFFGAFRKLEERRRATCEAKVGN